MPLHLTTLIVGFIALAWGADRFVLGAAVTARRLGVTPLVIGLTVVAFGTSAPEMLVSALAAWQGNPSLALGNALGSNIANIALILGSTALVTPLVVRSHILRREMPILLIVMAFSLLLLIDGQLSRLDGLLLLGGLLLLIGYLLYAARARESQDDILSAEFAQEIPADIPLARALGQLALGLIVLLISARLLVWAGVEIAYWLGVSDLIIGLSIVALGTSLPELAAAIASVRRGEHDIAIGNIIGSNMFNLLGVVGLAGAIHPTPLEAGILVRDFGVMTMLTLGFIIMSHTLGRRERLGPVAGASLLAAYVGYQSFLYIAA